MWYLFYATWTSEKSLTEITIAESECPILKIHLLFSAVCVFDVFLLTIFGGGDFLSDSIMPFRQMFVFIYMFSPRHIKDMLFSYLPCRYSFPHNYKFNGTIRRTSLIRRVNCDIFIIQFQTHEYIPSCTLLCYCITVIRFSWMKSCKHTIPTRIIMMIMMIIIQSC